MSILKISVLNTQKYLSYVMKNLEKAEEMPSDYFLAKEHKILHHSLQDMYQKNMSFDDDNLATLCMEKGYSVDNVKKDIKNIYESFNDKEDDIDFVKQKLKDFYVRHYIQNGLYQKLVSESDTKDELINVDELETIKDELEAKINELRGKRVDLKSTKDLSKEYATYIEKRDSGAIPKRIIGLNPIDKVFNGYTCDAGEMSIIAGFTGSAKSILCKNIEKNLITQNVPVLSLNLEMSQNRTMDRKVAMYSGLPIYDVVREEKTEETKNRILSFLRKFEKHNNYKFSAERGMNLFDVEQSVRQAREEFLDLGVMTKEDDYMVVTIDLLKMVDEFSGERWETVEKAVDKLHAISAPDKLNFHVIGIMQGLDDVFDRGKKTFFKNPEDLDYFKIDLSMIEGGKIFRSRARAIYTLTRPLYMKKRFFPEKMDEWNIEKRDIVNINLVKSNNSEVGFWKYSFDSNFRMYEYIETEEDLKEKM